MRRRSYESPEDMQRRMHLFARKKAREEREREAQLELVKSIGQTLERGKSILERTSLISFPGEEYALSDRTLSGYANVFGNVDSHRDIVRPGAFDEWMRWYRSQDQPLLLLNEHTQAEDAVLGVATEVKADGHGLLTTFTLLESAATNVVTRVRDKRYDGLSIGYLVLAEEAPTAEERARGAERAIIEAFVREVSLVREPANTSSRVIATKSAGQIVIDRVLSALNRRNVPQLDDVESDELLARIRSVLRRDAPSFDR